jgi:N-acetylated-alpha-linked acidic dipeptidase
MDPQTGVSVFERSKAQRATQESTSAAKKEAYASTSYPLGAMGSGSDYSSFIQHLGIPSLNIGYGGEGSGGEYHSIYDSYDMYRRFKDPTFIYGVTLAQTAGRVALRLADADALPFDYTVLHTTIKGYVNELINNVDQLREKTLIENELVNKKAYAYAADPAEGLTIPMLTAEVPYIDFSALLNALAKLEKAAVRVEEIKATGNAAQLATLNSKIYTAEQKLLSETGLPRRPWFKHTIYAPGFYTGYGVKTVPGVREAIEQKNWPETKEQITETAKAIEKLSMFLDAL